MSKVLVVEDSASIRLLLRRRLEMADHHVTDARDGAEAIKRLEEMDELETPDLILLDAMMPRVSGVELLERIKGDSPQTPVLVVSAVSGLEKSSEWSLADGHVRKPIDFAELLAHIDLLTGERPRP